MKNIFSLSLFTVGILSKETLIVKEDPMTLGHNRPEVQAYDCKKCFYEEEDTLLCTTYGSSVQLGW